MGLDIFCRTLCGLHDPRFGGSKFWFKVELTHQNLAPPSFGEKVHLKVEPTHQSLAPPSLERKFNLKLNLRRQVLEEKLNLNSTTTWFIQVLELLWGWSSTLSSPRLVHTYGEGLHSPLCQGWSCELCTACLSMMSAPIAAGWHASSAGCQSHSHR